MEKRSLTVRRLADSYENEIINWRRWIHAHPELSGREEKTAAFIAQTLRDMGISPQENVGGYGVVGLIKGKGPGRCVALRADFDALPIPEETGLPFASENAGVSHSCGHDMHTAMLLGAARILMDMRESFSGTVKLIFQPSEENAADSGAKKMIADGALADPEVDAVIGQHVSPQCPSGKITFRCGAMSSASDRFFFAVHGRSSHASKPESGIDAIAVGAEIVSALQSVVSRNVSPLDSTVVTIGKVSGGTRYNVLADTFEAEGTCRNKSEETRSTVRSRMETIIKGISEGMGAEYSFRYVDGYSPVINSPEMCSLLTKTASDMIGNDNIIPMEHASMGGEDFCFYAQKVPGVFFHLGCQKEGEPFFPLHNGCITPDESVLKTGTMLLAASAMDFLSP